MNKNILDNWNEVVNKEDVGIFIGDLSAGLMGRQEEFSELLKKFNGYKILIRGNHDHEPDEFYLNSGFVKITEHLLVSGVLFYHHPPSDDRVDNKSLPGPTRIAIRHIKRYKPWAFIHGHDHRRELPERDGCFNCASDRLDFKPILLKDALGKIDIEKTQKNFKHIESCIKSIIDIKDMNV